MQNQKIESKSKYPKPEADEFRRFAKSIGYEPNDIQYFIKAFDFQKIRNKHDGKNRNNFVHSAMGTVGDALLKFVIAEYLYPCGDKGTITIEKEKYEKNETLLEIAREHGFECLYYDESGTHDTGKLPSEIPEVPDQFEATVYAIYLDLGLPGVREWVREWFIDVAKDIIKNNVSE